MSYKAPLTRTQCKNCGKEIVLDSTYYRHVESGWVQCDPNSSEKCAEAK